MTSEEADDLLKELMSLSEDGEDEKLTRRFEELCKQGVQIEVDVSTEAPEFFEEGGPYTEVMQTCRLNIDGHCVYEWAETYTGSYGGGGTGWWIGKDHSELDSDVEDLLDALSLLPSRPEVPEPDTAD